MGVHGLWRLIEPSGKPVPLETLENKILAVDISIWLHQAIKGFQDSRGAALPNAHLLGIYHRVCKLLYFRIRPVFVFDGGVPVLKKQTIAKRYQLKTKIQNDADNIQAKLLSTLLKHSAVKNVIGEKSNAMATNIGTEKKNEKEDMFILPEKSASEADTTIDSSYSSDDESSSSPSKHWDLHTIDEKSQHFRSLPADVRHEILTDIKETRKQSSWGRLHELPTQSGDFSSFQMKRLLKRYSVQVSLEEAQKEMGGHTLSLGELEALLTEEGIVTAASNAAGRRIASCADTRFLLIKDVKKEMEKAKKVKELETETKIDTNVDITNQESSSSSSLIEHTSKYSDYEKDLAEAIQLSLQDQSSSSKDIPCSTELSFLENFNDGDFESESESDEERSLSLLAQAKSYMMEYSGLTPNEIAKILNKNGKKGKSSKKDNIFEKSKETSNYEMSEKNYETDNILYTMKENIEELEDSELSKGSRIITSEQILSSTENLTEMSEKLAVYIDGNDHKIISDSELKAEDVTEVLNTQNGAQEKGIQNISNNSVQTRSDSDESDFLETTESNNQVPTNTLSVKNTLANITEIISGKEDISNICNASVDLMSDSDESDFVEVNDKSNKTMPEIEKRHLEIVINPKDNLEDDIFSDIFTTNQTEIKTQPTITVEQKIKEIPKETTPKKIETEQVSSINENNEEIECVVENATEISDNTEPINQPEKLKLTVEELNTMKGDLAVEQQQLMHERNTKERMAGNITDQMYQEAQELLELFGVPYVIAPMEAEAQCAFFNEIDLTDGTITDDSDIWLFGGKTVYKNFFNHNKHVLQFRSENIEHHFKLTREHLILLALLVGSDYTLGIQGIGPVTALEILASFPPTKDTSVTVLTQNELITGLAEFRKWLVDGRAVGVGRTALKSKLRNVTVSEGFPNLQVVQAYLQPKVETSRDRFTWGKPDIVGLIDFAKDKFGWTKVKSEEILKPVIRRLEEKHTQKSIKDYFATKHKIDIDSAQNKMSKRVKTAVNRMGKKQIEEEESSKPKRQTTRKTKINDQTSEKIKQNDNKPSTSKRKPKEKVTKEYTEEFIPQKERDKNDALKSKLKAIEIFRKSKQGPGFVKKRPQVVRKLKEEAELSENSSSD